MSKKPFNPALTENVVNAPKKHRTTPERVAENIEDAWGRCWVTVHGWLGRELQGERLAAYVEGGAAAWYASDFWRRGKREQMKLVRHVRSVQAERLAVDELATEAIRSIMAAPAECLSG